MDNLTPEQVAVLSDVARALRDDNIEPRVATVNADINWRTGTSADYGDGKEYMPVPKGVSQRGNVDLNALHAQSIALGEGITMRHVGQKYIVRTPSGEAEFKQTNNDFFSLWRAAVLKSEGHDMTSRLKLIRNEELRNIINGPDTPEMSKAEKLEAAREKMKKMGVKKTAHLDAYIAQQMQNQND